MLDPCVAGRRYAAIGLVPAVVDAVAPIPVVAAGGIAEGRGLAATLMLAAAGVSMGTQFTATRESLWNPAMKAKALVAGGDDTMQTRVFDIVSARNGLQSTLGRAGELILHRLAWP